VASNTTLPVATVFTASTTITSTKTIIPQRVTSTTTKTIATINVGKPSVQVVQSTNIVTPTCTVPPRQPTRDPKVHFKPRLGGPHATQIQAILAKAIPTLASGGSSNGSSSGSQGSLKAGVSNALSSSSKWRTNGRRVELDRVAFVQARNERLAVANVRLAKRAPDEPIVIVNATDTAAYPT
jgi:hypothetical protein